MIITGKDQGASAALRGVKAEAGGLGGALGKLTTIAGGVFAGGAALAGAKSLVGFLSSATQAAADDAASQARLKQAVENTGASYADYNAILKSTIDQGQRLGFTDDQTRDSLSILTAQTGSAEEAMKRYALAQDLARGANIDVVTASRLLGKVTEENVNVLARYGISVKEGATETELFGAIQQKFGGQSAAFADTTAGKMEQAKIRFGEMKEALGAQLLPALTAVMDFLVTTGIPALEKLSNDVMPTVKAVIGDVSAFIKANWTEISAVFNFVFEYVKARIEGMIQVIKAIVEIVTSTIALVKAIFHGDWATAWAEMKDIAGAMIDLLVGYVKTMFGNLPGIILDLAADAYGAAQEWGKRVYDGIVEWLSSLPSRMLQLGKDAANAFLEGLGDISIAGVSVNDLVPGGDLGRASGGPVSAGRPYVVGERGPELFVPRQSGMIEPNGSMGGGVTVHIAYASFTGSPSDARATVGDIGFALQRELRARGV